MSTRGGGPKEREMFTILYDLCLLSGRHSIPELAEAAHYSIPQFYRFLDGTQYAPAEMYRRILPVIEKRCREDAERIYECLLRGTGRAAVVPSSEQQQRHTLLQISLDMVAQTSIYHQGIQAALRDTKPKREDIAHLVAALEAARRVISECLTLFAETAPADTPPPATVRQLRAGKGHQL